MVNGLLRFIFKNSVLCKLINKICFRKISETIGSYESAADLNPTLEDPYQAFKLHSAIDLGIFKINDAAQHADLRKKKSMAAINNNINEKDITNDPEKSVNQKSHLDIQNGTANEQLSIMKRFYGETNSLYQAPIPLKLGCRRCEICSAIVENEQQLIVHYAQHTDQFRCGSCGLGFKILIDYIVHVQIHSSDKLFRCTICGVTKKNSYLIKRHLYCSHEQLKQFKCGICGKGFYLYDWLMRHMKTHSVTKFLCDICGGNFPDYKDLQNHVKLAHYVENQTYQQPEGATVSNDEYLFKTFPNKVKIPKKLIICDIDDKQLYTKYVLTTNDQASRPYKCRFCDKSFIGKSVLEYHEKIHNADRPFLCRFCGKDFKIKCLKNDHERIHTGEKPYICSYCGKAFATYRTKKGHEKVHIRSELYHCPFCDREYRERENMIRHSKIHEDTNTYICFLCNKRFYLREDIIEHCKTHRQQ